MSFKSENICSFVITVALELLSTSGLTTKKVNVLMRAKAMLIEFLLTCWLPEIRRTIGMPC